MSKPRRLREVVVPTPGGRWVSEGEDLSRINQALLRIQQTAKSPPAATKPSTTKPTNRK
jgi:hypothetical protein